MWVIFSFGFHNFCSYLATSETTLQQLLFFPQGLLFVYLFSDLVRLFHSSLSPLKCAACDVSPGRDRSSWSMHSHLAVTVTFLSSPWLSLFLSVPVFGWYHTQLLAPKMLVRCSIVSDKAPGHKLLHSQFQLNSRLFAGLLFGGLPLSFIPT